MIFDTTGDPPEKSEIGTWLLLYSQHISKKNYNIRRKYWVRFKNATKPEVTKCKTDKFDDTNILSYEKNKHIKLNKQKTWKYVCNSQTRAFKKYIMTNH